MSNLENARCEACHADAPQVSDEELKELMREIPDWTPVTKDNVMMLQREFKFKNCKVTVTWWTHAINGLHKNDFIMAAKTDTVLDA